MNQSQDGIRGPRPIPMMPQALTTGVIQGVREVEVAIVTCGGGGRGRGSPLRAEAGGDRKSVV